MFRLVCLLLVCSLFFLTSVPTYSSEEDADILKIQLDAIQADLSSRVTFAPEEFGDFFATLDSIASRFSELKRIAHSVLPFFNRETGNPHIAVVGGGYTGVLSSILLAGLKKADGTPALDVHLFEKNLNVLNGASTAPARLHLGGEYPKDPTTALQCLISALIFRQMFPEELILTSCKRIDFLLAKVCTEESEDASESKGGPEPDGDSERLTLAELQIHYQKLKETYEELFKQFSDWGGDVAGLLFGLPDDFFDFLDTSGKIDDERLRGYFTGGVRTSERGLQPVALGVVLERLLAANNVHVHLGRSVSKVRSIDGEGYGFLHYSKNDKDEREFFARYVVNAAWDEAPYLTYQASLTAPVSVATTGGSLPLDPIQNQPPTKVYLRSIGLFDVSRCAGIPEDRSYFGLVGEAGAMVSFFSPTVAMIYVPKKDLSYQGLYNLSFDSERKTILDTAAQTRLEMLNIPGAQGDVLYAMLSNAQEKYPFLRGAEPIQLITQTTLSWDSKVYQRQHIKPNWPLGERSRWINASSTKATFGPLIALQVLGEMTRQEDIGRRVRLSPEARTFLARVCGADLSNIGEIDPGVMQALLSGFVRVPEEFVLFRETLPARDPVFLAEMQLYAFKRRLPMAMVEVFASIPASLGLADQIPLIDWRSLDHVDLRSLKPTPRMLAALADAIRRLPPNHRFQSFRFQYYAAEEDISEEHARVGVQVLESLSGERRSIKELEIDGLWFTLADEIKALKNIIMINRLERLILTGFASSFPENNSLYPRHFKKPVLGSENYH